MVNQIKKNLFRPEAVKKIEDPENLNEYIKISSPSVWILSTATALFLIALIIWGVFFKIDNIVKIGAICKNGVASCFVKETDYEKIKKIKLPEAIINGQHCSLQKVDSPIRITESCLSYAMHLSGLKPGDWAFLLNFKNGNLPDGIFSGFILLNKISPVSFILK